MKAKLYFLLAATIFASGLASCTDFLREDNKVGETADLTYGTKSGIDGLVAGCYSFARGWYGKEAGLGLSEMGTDLFYYGFDNKQKSLLQYNLTAASLEDNVADNACLDHYWELFYCATDVCNNALKYVAASDQLDASTKSQYMGEAYFLRAFYYFHMVNIWGAVPYNSEPITAQETNPVRMPENEVYRRILADLDLSVAAFTEAGYAKKTDGRANLWSARALKARVLLYADMWSMNNEDCTANKEAIFGISYSSDLKSTVNCIPYRYKQEDGSPMQYNSLITRTGYSRGGSAMLLMFVSKWNNGCSDLGGNGVKNTNVFVRAVGESTFYITSAKTGEKVFVADKYLPYGRGFTRYLPSLRLWQLLDERRDTDQRTEVTLLDHYDIAHADLSQNAKNYPNLQDTAIYYSALDGDSEAGQALQAWAKNRYRLQFASGGDIPVYTSGDPATALPTQTAKALSDVYGDARYNSVMIGGWQSYPCMAKFLDNVYDSNYPTHDISSRDAIVIRLPEMYLIKAEAQLGRGDAAGAKTTLNELRAARAIAGQDNSFGGTVTLDVLLDERAVEFCGEQMRWFDLKRTGKLHEYVEKYNAQASTVLKTDNSKHFLYRPIPQAQIDAVTNYTATPNSTTGFWQNPGY